MTRNWPARFLRTIEKHTDRLTYLIEDLLTISRLESGQIVMNLHEVELREEAAHVMDDLQARAADKQVDLQNDVPADLHARADADRLQQVLFNLVENAIKYGRAEGSVTIGGQRQFRGQSRIMGAGRRPGHSGRRPRSGSSSGFTAWTGRARGKPAGRVWAWPS